MLPYIRVPDLKLGPLTLHPFGMLVATGVLLGSALAVRRARKFGLDVDKLNSFIAWMLVAGFAGGHVLDVLFYHPEEIARFEGGHFEWVRPWSLLFIWESLSSFGGFIGGVVGIVLWKYYEIVPRLRIAGFTLSWFKRRKEVQPILPFTDIILSVFPVSWIFGRSGCSVAHDHPGALAEPGAFLSVGYPAQMLGPPEHFELYEGPVARYDLGLMELLFTICLAGLIALTWKKRLATGTYVAVVSLAYAPVRFMMDFLRRTDGNAADPRYGGLTPAQWACLALFLFGVATALYVRGLRSLGVDPMERVLARPDPGGDAADDAGAPSAA